MDLLVTGADGFVGSHVVEAALHAGHSVTGVYRSESASAPLGALQLVGGDLAERWPAESAPDGIIHLASLAAVGRSFEDPQPYISSNTAMITHMCESLLRSGATHTRVVVVSTGGLYKPGLGARAEQDEIVMSSPYAVSKAAVELQCAYYRSRGLDIVVTRPFNHIGPGQARGFLLPDLFATLLDAAPGDELVVGNLDSRRDYTDVRDVARAYIELVAAPALRSSLFNIATGATLAGSDILREVCAQLGRNVPPLRIDSRRLRPNDPHEIVGDAGLISREVGWTPRIPLEESISDFVRFAQAPVSQTRPV